RDRRFGRLPLAPRYRAVRRHLRRSAVARAMAARGDPHDGPRAVRPAAADRHHPPAAEAGAGLMRARPHACSGEVDPGSPTRTCAKKSSEAGFTLLETLLATALFLIVIAALATITGQWLPAWNHGFARVQRTEHLAFGIERIVADVAS